MALSQGNIYQRVWLLSESLCVENITREEEKWAISGNKQDECLPIRDFDAA